MATQAQTLIRQLQNQGRSLSSIARQVGRDESYISQISRGKRSGESYIPALETMVRGGAPSLPRKPQKQKQPGIIRDEEKRIVTASSKTVDGVQMRRNIRNIGKGKGNIGVTVTVKNFQGYNMTSPETRTIHLWSHGVSAHYIDAMIDIHGSLSSAIEAELESLSNVEKASGIEEITVNAMY